RSELSIRPATAKRYVDEIRTPSQVPNHAQVAVQVRTGALRKQGAKCCQSLLRRYYCRCARRSDTSPSRLERAEEEQTIFYDRTAEREPERVLRVDRHRCETLRRLLSRAKRSKRARVDHVVERTVESIGSLSGYDVHYSAACASVLGGVVGAKHRHFLEAVTQRGLNLLSGDRVVVIVRAIDQLIVRARPETVDVELSALHEASGKHAGICYARQGKHEIYRVETGDWEVNDLPAFEGACLSAILFLEDDRSISVDVYDLALSADQELS